MCILKSRSASVPRAGPDQRSGARAVPSRAIKSPYDLSPFPVLFPELLLMLTASALFLLGLSRKAPTPAGPRRSWRPARSCRCSSVFSCQIRPARCGTQCPIPAPPRFYVFHFALYIKMIAAGVGVLVCLALLARWRRGHRQCSRLSFGHEAGEYLRPDAALDLRRLSCRRRQRHHPAVSRHRTGEHSRPTSWSPSPARCRWRRKPA